MNILLLNLAISWILVGLIWTIQLVHYPSFAYIDQQVFQIFHQHHTSSILLIVMPLMLLELGLAFYLAQHYNWQLVFLVSLIVVVLIWMSTFFVQVPLHNALEIEKDINIIQKLVTTNWFRTILWTGKAIWLTYFFRM